MTPSNAATEMSSGEAQWKPSLEGGRKTWFGSEGGEHSRVPGAAQNRGRASLAECILTSLKGCHLHGETCNFAHGLSQAPGPAAAGTDTGPARARGAAMEEYAQNQVLSVSTSIDTNEPRE